MDTSLRNYAFETIDVFTDRRFGGNPLAVLTDARGLSDGEMQAIAREFNLSETAFVLPARDPAHAAEVRIFTPASELAFAGHPNVGTALVLAARMPTRPDHLVFEQRAGLVPIVFDWSGVPTATLDAPMPLERGQAVPAEVIAACLALDVADIVTATHAPCVASVGISFAIAEVTAAGLERAAPDLGAMRDAASRVPLSQAGLSLHIYCRAGDIVRARMFAPLSGIAEDPATGSANAALAALLLQADGGEALRLTIRQGAEIGRPSLLHAAARRAADGVRASIGGSGVMVSTGTLFV